MAIPILPILKNVAISILWKYVRGYLITAIKDAEKLPNLNGAEKEKEAREIFKVLYRQNEGEEPSEGIMRKAAQQIPIIHDALEAAGTL